MLSSSKILTFLFLTLYSYAFAELEDFFKKAENKSSIHQMENIDFIYMINLDKRPEKYQMSLKALKRYDIVPYRFSAVNGWELENSTINQIGIIYNTDMNFQETVSTYTLIDGKEKIDYHDIKNEGTCYFYKNLSRGAIGIALSHLSVLQDAFDSGYETIWIMEDDVEVIRDPRIIPKLIKKLDVIDDNWDILFTDPETRAPNGKVVKVCATCPRPNFKIRATKYYCYRKKINKDFTLKRARYGAYSYIIRRSGIQKILEFYKKYKIYAAYDIDCFYAPDLKIYTCNKRIVSSRCDAQTDNFSAGYLK